MIAAALERALDWIARRQGADVESWQWGIEHPAAHRHPLFDAVPLLRDVGVGALSLRRRRATRSTAPIQAIADRPFEAVHGAGYRAVYDFSDLDNSRFAIPLGQSGNMLSRWSHNFVDGWKELRYVEISGTRAELVRSAVGITRSTAPPVDERPMRDQYCRYVRARPHLRASNAPCPSAGWDGTLTRGR